MNLIRSAIMLVVAAGLATSQHPAAESTAFEIASIKPHPMPAGRIVIRMYTMPGARFRMPPAIDTQTAQRPCRI